MNTQFDSPYSVSSSSTQTVRIGSNAGSTNLKIHERSQNAVVDIATVEDDVTSNCDVRLGGAAPNLASTTYIGTYQTKLAGTLEVAAFAGTSSARIFTPAATLNIGDGQSTTAVKLGVIDAKFQAELNFGVHDDTLEEKYR